MKKLAVFGCSWFHGVPGVGEKHNKLYDCWSLRFALQNEDYKVYNFARGGTCVNWSISRLLQFLQTPLAEDCKIVFPSDTTQIYSNVDACTQGNYNFLQYENYFVDRGTDPITHMPGNIALRKSMKLNFIEVWSKHYPDTYSFIEHEAQIAYLKNICNFVYRHNSSIIKFYPNLKKQTYKNIWCKRNTPQSKMERICCPMLVIILVLKGLQWIANISKEKLMTNTLCSAPGNTCVNTNGLNRLCCNAVTSASKFDGFEEYWSGEELQKLDNK